MHFLTLLAAFSFAFANWTPHQNRKCSDSQRDCPPLNNLTGRSPVLQPLCDQCTALKIVPLLTDQFFDNLNFQKYRAAEDMLSEENFFAGKIVMDEACCKDVCGEIVSLFAEFYANQVQFRYKIMRVEYNDRNGNVLVKLIAMQVDGMNIERIYYGKMLWIAETFCNYKLNYLNLVEFTCTEEDYRYGF